ncbi:UDP-glucose 4-epimerase GalE [Psittacicella hinzii]|uniref:UDP-glucose 4-epimerase n=1 Tax=Psittacicella hinzii TaxID=2028575 RepID=A0A3A1YT95_9GAMM|nr:UDP-glucose 4-epimerase GalE [Psittacicella hinzii]RIY40469.1 UDP-glucose 4-epimerase GalE [Psittacicella hinzii]
MTQKTKTILVTGGLGFIGSHTALELVEQGYEVVIVDNLYNSYPESETNIRRLLTPEQNLRLHVNFLDLCDKNALSIIFRNYQISQVIHFAAYKAVGESCAEPIKYYRNNLITTLSLVETMLEHNCYDLVYSSSMTVYGDTQEPPHAEDSIVYGVVSNPYAQTKVFNEIILKDITNTAKLRVITLRYANPVAAHPSGKLGEVYRKPLNVFPAIYDTYLGKQPILKLFGDQYPTKDGTCERDYIHIMDLVEGHILTLNYFDQHPELKFESFNLCSGTPYSVKEIVQAFNEVSDRFIQTEIVEPRPGDLATNYACPKKAQRLLGFTTKRDLKQMCIDSVRYLQYLTQK